MKMYTSELQKTAYAAATITMILTPGRHAAAVRSVVKTHRHDVGLVFRLSETVVSMKLGWMSTFY